MRARRAAALLLSALVLAGSAPGVAVAAPGGGVPPCHPYCEDPPPNPTPQPPPDVTADGDEIDVVVKRGRSQAVPGRGGTANGPAPARRQYVVIDEYMTPACSANGLFGDDALCMAAISCPADDQLRYWVWHRETDVDLDRDPQNQVGEWRREPGSYCLGPDDPGIPSIGRVIAAVQVGFASLPLPRFGTQISPAPRTLVNIPTKLRAGQATPVPLSTSPLGVRVDIVATPVSWRWTFGDGSKATTTVPFTEHVYRRAAVVGASVRVTWTGTFRVAGAPETFTINAPAYVQGPPAQVDVRTARSELIDGS